MPDELEPVDPGAALGAVVVAPGEPDVVVSVDELGDVVVVVSVDELGDDGVVEVDGADVVGGDADGVRSPGRSLVRGVPLSVHAVASVATSARAEKPNSALFMDAPPE